MKRNLVIATVAAAALVGGGTATAVAVGSSDDDAPAKKSSVQVRDDAQDDDGDDAKEDAAEAEDDAARAKAAKLTAGEAVAKALADTSGTAVSAELDSDDGDLVWDVDVLGAGANGTWTSVAIDPGTGKVLGSHGDDDGGDDGAKAVRDALKGSGTTAAKAAEAVTAAKDGKVTAVELDDDGAGRVWQVETTTDAGEQQEWQVPLDSAKVTAAPADTDDSDDD